MMNRWQACLVLAGSTLLAAAATAQTDAMDDATPAQRAEFSKLVQQRNELYGQLKAASDASQTRWVQNQLDMVEGRITELSGRYSLDVPPRPVAAPGSAGTTPASRSGYGYGAGAGAGAAGMPGISAPTPKQRAEFNKLVLRRNKLSAQLSQLDDQAAELVKRGEKPLVINARQVSVQDELDLVELQLAIQATRYGLAVPPAPGSDPLPPGHGPRADDEATRNMEQAFARGRQRTVKRLHEETDQFLASLELGAFLDE